MLRRCKADVVAFNGAFSYNEITKANEITKTFRKKFYKISAWLGTYFPIRFVVTSLALFYPRPYSVIILECVIFAIYLMTATLISILPPFAG